MLQAEGAASSKAFWAEGSAVSKRKMETMSEVAGARCSSWGLGTRNGLRCTGGSTGSSSHAQETLGAGVWSPAVVSRARGEYGTVF